ncbi:hypothetical protein CLV24_106231 [Pontibacter ummariensis]|uniref:Acetyltransferase (GNAT) family protein n=1 Tax=Pontibacter ummariensis TaxID=1610492 RepID=A0A239EKJ9_9BACT|nr:hypothetical protein [Pontibacter ummariensis]PRY13316.1 hypothetical protein CLV24_106231 [Pontibacter ummariensis]SNS45290.1 hypothetical protein SAMN06296052_106231 [Pontibacter ummariensis]
MDNVTINPGNYKAEYIKNLNTCFKGWGQEKEYDWAFGRVVGDKPADIMLIHHEDKEVIAGSAVTYRKLEKPNGDTVDIAIMTGSWTLPKARGQGCFTKIIHLSKAIAAQKKVPYLAAFVTESNASYRRLRDAGSTLVPTYLLFSPGEPYPGVDAAEVVRIEGDLEEVMADVFNRYSQSQTGTLSFRYTPDEFRSQFLNRPKAPELLKIGPDYALVEETHNALKVLLLAHDKGGSFETIIKALTNWALENRGKKLLYFTTQNDLSKACQEMGFENVPGFFTILPTSDAADAQELMQIMIHSGDKM